jgi:hypothetical protein
LTLILLIGTSHEDIQAAIHPNQELHEETMADTMKLAQDNEVAPKKRHGSRFLKFIKSIARGEEVCISFWDFSHFYTHRRSRHDDCERSG